MVFVAWMFVFLKVYDPMLLVAVVLEFVGGVVVGFVILLDYSECVLWDVDLGVCFSLLQYPIGGMSVFRVKSVLECVLFESELIYFMYNKLSVKWWLSEWH